MIHLPRGLVAVFLLTLLYLFSGCDSVSEEGERYDLHKGLSVAETQNPEVPLVASHEDGGTIGVLYDSSRNRPRGGVFISEQGDELLVELDEDGYPSRAYVNDHVVLFENYEGRRVDLAVVTPRGRVEIVRGVEIEGADAALNRLNNASAKALSWSGALEIAGAGLSIGSCAIASAKALATVGIAIPLVALACSNAVIKTTALLLPEDETGLRASTAGFGAIASGVGCAAEGLLGNPLECAAVAVDVVTGVVVIAKDRFAESESEIATATGALRFAGIWKRRDIQDAWFSIDEENIADIFYSSSDNCYSFFRGSFIKVDGNVFTYENAAGSRVELEYVLVEDDVIEITRLSDGQLFVLDRTERQVDSFVPSCQGGDADKAGTTARRVASA